MNLTRLPFAAFATVLASTSFAVSSLAPAAAQPPQKIAQTSSGICPVQLDNAIHRIISRFPRTRWSVLVQTQAERGNRQNVYALNPFTQLVPASNNKIFTTAAALKKLGPQYRIRTAVYGNTAGPDLATLRVIGQGDPSLSTAHLNSFAQQLRQRGIRQVQLLIGDDTIFRGASFNPFWDNQDRGQGYAAPVNSLMLNENNIYTGAVPNPGNYFVREFRNTLTKSGIRVIQSTLVKRIAAPPNEVELAFVTSPPLTNLLFETNQSSNNMYAEALLKTLGRQQDPTSLNATDSGVAAVKAILTDLGVNPNRYTMVDGSGLALRNRASAEAFVQTLQAMAQLPEGQLYRQSLAVGGMSGTLKNRFRNGAKGIVSAKTGTVSGAISLSGYVTPPNYSPLVFSIVTNSAGYPSGIRTAIDKIVVLLTRLQSC